MGSMSIWSCFICNSLFRAIGTLCPYLFTFLQCDLHPKGGLSFVELSVLHIFEKLKTMKVKILKGLFS